MIRISVLGSINLDCVAWADRLPKLGESLQGNRFSMFTGGKGANQAVQASRLGADVYMIGCIGNDSAGKMLLQSLKKDNINIQHIKVKNKVNSGACCIHVDRKGDNSIIVAPQANLLIERSDIEAAAATIKNSDIFITQLETNIDVVKLALKIAKDNGVTTVLNPAPAKDICEELFKKVDYFIPNETEAEFYTGILRKDMEIEKWKKSVCSYLFEKGVKNLIITMGEKGAFYSNGKEEFSIKALNIEAVDSTAAGDAFIAAFAYAVAKGDKIGESVKMGCAAGAHAAMNSGAQSSLGRLDKILKLFIKNY